MAQGLKKKNGDPITGFTAAVMFDKGAAETPKPRVLKAQFGDGYEMRIRDGINNTPRSWSLVFNNRTNTDIDKLYTFFQTLAGVDTCMLTVPDSVGGDDDVIVVIEEYNKTFSNAQFYSMNCTAREVFEL
jgi:phage-related protein